ncbi:MAG: hypothetical protein KUG78_13285 [Kangiellaceae bacterium]|nr:hypothetical protein [Kangiellaceae bacterium]
MDWQIRIALLVAGCALVGYILYDYNKKKKIQQENDKLKRQFGNLDEQVDSAGFDMAGVGVARQSSKEESEFRIDDDKELKIDSREASRIAANEVVSARPKLQGTSIDSFISQEDDNESFTENLDNKNSELANKLADVAGSTLNENIGAARRVESDTQFKQADQNSQTNPNVRVSQTEQINQSEQVPHPHSIDQQVHPETLPNENEIQRPDAMVLSLTLQAAEGYQFKGRDFLPIFLSQGLRHGEMGIFHRRMRAGAKPGPVLFSLANGIAPGTFEVNNLEGFETPAFALFMTMPGPEDSQVAYNAMYKTCLLLQQELGGDILDETKSVYSKQTHNHRLDQIRDYNFKLSM